MRQTGAAPGLAFDYYQDDPTTFVTLEDSPVAKLALKQQQQLLDQHLLSQTEPSQIVGKRSVAKVMDPGMVH